MKANNRHPFLAHVRQDQCHQWCEHSLEEHLRAVAQLAADYAASFGSSDWAYTAGLWHDLGKYRTAFQDYIRNASGYDCDAHIETAPGRVDHSSAGALYAEDKLGPVGRVIAYLIAGHHAGLPDYESAETGRRALKNRLQQGKNNRYLEESLRADIPADILKSQLPGSPPLGGSTGFHLWARMLFSCLVDADFIDTERFMTPESSQLRSDYPSIKALLEQFNTFMQEFTAEREPTPIDAIRRQILDNCRDVAGTAAGFFSLTVPTGGGKTLSSLAFALEHAKHYGKRRIIYVIPYTSIIEQTADVFRQVFEPLGDIVIEHHSQADIEPARETLKSRLACENWDAPLIVTTNVQFFESLYAARTSQCRKLHNIVDSVVILDEAQMLPPDYLQTITQTIDLLRRHYGVTFVLCTATQPELGSRKHLGKVFKGLDEINEIVPDVDALYRSLQRVRVEMPADVTRRQSWQTIADELREHRQVLCVVNGARRDVRELWRLMPGDTFHLSALMCGQHRSDVLRQIRHKLDAGENVRVISTPLVEAGVDVDFPVVYRALGGLDSIAQAAGRCNRNGKLEYGEVKVFTAPNSPPPGLLRTRENKTRELLQILSDDPLHPDGFKHYFDLLYGAVDTDKKDIVALTQVDRSFGLAFRTLAARFRLIDDSDQHTVCVRYGQGGALIDQLQSIGPERWLMRKLQRYSVTIYENEFKQMLNDGSIESLHGIFVQTAENVYDRRLGLMINLDYSAESLII
jgi:CRISPR-associated endonuclease/helicase Cas3